MMNNGSFGQFQRGNSCNQGRGQNSCVQPQPRSCPPPCNQPQPRPTPSCNQPQPRPVPSCNQPQPRPTPPPCNQSQGRPPRRPVGPSCPCKEMNREQLLQWISFTKFACVDSELYMDTNPCDTEAVAYFKEHVKLYNEALTEYSKTYGPLTLAHAHHCDTYWDWVNQPWPWQ